MPVKQQRFSFKIMKKDRRSKARLGILRTPHGTIKTPSYVMVATHAQVKGLRPGDLKRTKTQIVIANTFHLWDPTQSYSTDRHPPAGGKGRALSGARKASKESFILERLGTKMPTMTDSGGFQVFSLGAAKEHKVGKVLKRGHYRRDGESKLDIREEGAYFTIDDQERFLSPELSIQIQEKLGADIIFSFDECTSPLHPFAYNKQAMERTHRWAVRCLKAFHKVKSLDEIRGGRSEQSRQQGRSERGGKGDEQSAVPSQPNQWLFGIVQGGTSTRLRTQSAKYIGSLPFEGFGIGGSFGENEMANTLGTVVQYLPEEKPRHLLGIGRVKDIFIAVENGVDLFDCVIPTREGRHGRIWTKKGFYDIRKTKYKDSNEPLENNCGCPTCKTKTQEQIHVLFKNQNAGVTRDGRPSFTKASAGRFATIHNIWFFNTLLERIRRAILAGSLSKLKKEYLM